MGLDMDLVVPPAEEVLAMDHRREMYPTGYFRLLDRALIGALVFLVVLLLGIQIARATDAQEASATTPTAAAQAVETTITH
jgi:hypothetical protein